MMKCEMCGMMMKDENDMRMHMDMMRSMMMHMMKSMEMMMGSMGKDMEMKSAHGMEKSMPMKK